MTKVKPTVVIAPRDDRVTKIDRRHEFQSGNFTVEDLIAAELVDWDPRDPGVGQAFLLPDGREIFNPVPFAPPIGFVDEPDVLARMRDMLRQELARRKAAEEVVDQAEEMNDFPEDDERPFYSDYELVMLDDFPAAPDLQGDSEDLPAVPTPAPAPPKDEPPEQS